jgi:hypothetical protein
MGNIQSPRLIVEEGAILEGSCSMLKARETQEEEAESAGAEYEEPQSTQISLVGDSDDDDDESAYLTDEEDDDEDESADAAKV